MAPTVWVTRTAPFNRLTARHLSSAGYDPVMAPVLKIVPARRRVPFAVPDALVFTSLNGIRLHAFAPALADLPVFTVGDHSARFARARGYRRVVSAGGDVNDLRRMVCETMWDGADILHIGAASPAGALAEKLGEDGLHTRRLRIYDVVEAGPLDLEWVAGCLDEITQILIHSPRAGRHVAHWLGQQATSWRGDVLCISQAAAKPFAMLSSVRVKVPPRPDESSLLATLFKEVRP